MSGGRMRRIGEDDVITDRTHRPEPKPVTQADLLSWAKVAAIVAPLLLAVVGSAVKLSGDAQAIRADVDHLKIRVAEHGAILEAQRGVSVKVAEVAQSLVVVSDELKARTLQQVAIDERLNAQNERTKQFWAVTWPGIEARLKRIEDKIDRGR
jgi:hypothetical protein